MKWSLYIAILLLCCTSCFSQGEDDLEDKMDEQVSDGAADEEDDSWLLQLQELKKHPVNLNTGDLNQLQQLPFVTALHLANLIKYRSLMGDLIDLMELQAVPGWEPSFIRKLLPFVTISHSQLNLDPITLLRVGKQSLFVRVAQSFNSPPGNDVFIGSAQYLLLRYRLNVNKKLSFGALAEKDVGEKLIRHGLFDFNSCYLSISPGGLVKKIIVGDFQVNLGQGLIQWQSLGVHKGSSVLSIKNQSDILRENRSAGEVKFHRGVAIQFHRKIFELTGFLSSRSLSANTFIDSGSVETISSVVTSGLHRTNAEIKGKGILKQLASGANLQVKARNFEIGANYVSTAYSKDFNKPDDPYKQLLPASKAVHNLSINYGLTFLNFHLFGEYALDKHLHFAIIQGMLLSLGPRFDLSVFYRFMSPRFESRNVKAFTATGNVINEHGIYFGGSLRTGGNLKCDWYFDFYQFPWLRFQTDAPSMGRDCLFRFTWEPNRSSIFYLQFRQRTSEENTPDSFSPMNTVQTLAKNSLRLHARWNISREVIFEHRAETVESSIAGESEEGFLSYLNVEVHPYRSPLRAYGRVLFFQTDSYQSRIYASEYNGASTFATTACYGKGWLIALNANCKLKEVDLFGTQVRPPDVWISFKLTSKRVGDQHERSFSISLQASYTL